MTTYDNVTVQARPELSAATRGTYIAFIGCGFAFASWASRLPQVRDGLHLTSSALGLVLLMLAAGSITALLLAGVIVSRFHSRRTVAAMAILMGVALVAVGLGYLLGVVPLVAGLFVFGFASGAWDVAMNVQGAAVERGLGRSIMPRFHAGYSVGTVVGALVGAAMVALHVPVTAHLLAVAVAVGATVPAAVRSFIADTETDTTGTEPDGRDDVRTAGTATKPEGHTAAALRRWREPRTLLVGVVVLAFAFAEGAGIDWISLSLIDSYAQPAVLGTLALAAFLASMTLARWFSEGVLARFGRVVVVRAQALLAIAGILVFVFSPVPALAFAAVLLWGVGASLGFPVGMSAASDEPTAAAGRVSVVASIGYCAFLAGPPLIGYLGQHVTVHRALIAVAVVLALATLATGALRPLPIPSRSASQPGD
jgi:predicted MFS family arabinose efflux permease